MENEGKVENKIKISGIFYNKLNDDNFDNESNFMFGFKGI
jgi:hypothetical protein